MENRVYSRLPHLDTYEFIRHIESIRALRKIILNTSRHLTNIEIDTLALQGNRCDNWEQIRVDNNFSTAHIHRSYFFGECFLGRFDGSECPDGQSFALPNGIFDSTIKNSIIDDGAAIWKCSGICNFFIGKAALLVDNGIISCGQDVNFGNGTICTIGNETGGRELSLFAELTVSLADKTIRHTINTDAYATSSSTYTDAIRNSFGIIDQHAHVVSCRRITNAFIGSFAQVKGATLLDNVTLLSSSNEPVSVENGAVVKNSCLQWGSSVDTMAIVDRSLLAEHSHVERHGKVTSSIIGPNTGIAEGEVTSCLVGPFVGFHHQALLIGALWPLGKGNVAYGANVGSNHTAKAPDQEIYCGEGVFFGLGVNIKFPADFTHAPYSIIATGVCTLPQRVAFPFSLINTPSQIPDGISPAINELLPAWVLSDNLFLVKRNEAKFAQRNKAKREQPSFEVFRPEIIDMMVTAVAALTKVPQECRYVFEKELPGCGKNFVTAGNIKKAIETYTMFIEYYVLVAYMRVLSASVYKNDLSASHQLFSATSSDAVWEHARNIDMCKYLDTNSEVDNLKKLGELTTNMHTLIVRAKEKDDVRGRAIMNDYDTAHKKAEDDPFIITHAAETSHMLQNIDALIRTFDRT